MSTAGLDAGTWRGHRPRIAGSISTILLSDGTKRYRARYRDAGGRQHEKRYKRKVDAQHGLDEQTSALVTQTWTAPER